MAEFSRLRVNPSTVSNLWICADLMTRYVLNIACPGHASLGET
jgi:hypothetical protein